MAKQAAKLKRDTAPFAVPDWPAMKAETWPLDRIKPYDKNPRTHPDEQIETLARLMKEYGVDQPIVVDEDGIIIKGHGRLLAAQRAGFKEFPVVKHIGLSDQEKRALRIVDNQVALLSGWDEEFLRFEVNDLIKRKFDVQLLGFPPEELQSIMSGWDTGSDILSRHGEHLDGISSTIRITVAAPDTERAREAITKALTSKGIAFEAQ